MAVCRPTSVKIQQGSAIVFAMGMSLLVVGLSVALLLWLTLDIRRVAQLSAGSERLSGVEFSEAIAAEKIASLPENWMEPWEVKHQDKTVRAKIDDLSGRININTLLLRGQKKGIPSAFEPKSVILRLLEKLHTEDPQGIIDVVMNEREPLFGVSALEDMIGTKQYFYAMDSEQQQVNINATHPVVLASILDIAPSVAEKILAEKPFESTKNILDVLAKYELTYEPITPIETWLGVEGKYYSLETTFSDKRTLRIYSVFRKDADKITLLWRSWGTLP